MKQSVAFQLFCSALIGTLSLNVLAFVPTASRNRNTHGHSYHVGRNTNSATYQGDERSSFVLLSSSTGNLESVSSDEIIGPELPPIKGTSKRLFLVRHGEVINPGEDCRSNFQKERGRNTWKDSSST